MRRSRLFLLAALVAATLAPGQPRAEQYTLSFGERAVVYRVAPSRAQWLARVERARARYEVFVTRITGRSPMRIIAIAPPAAVAVGPITDIMSDPTLRADDLYVSSEGVLKFRGPAAMRHVHADFIRLSDRSAKGLGIELAVAP